MADSTFLSNLNLNVSTMQVQSFMGIVFYVILAGLFIFVLGLLLRKLYNNLTYTTHVTIRQEVGDIQISQEDRARKIEDGEGNYFFHYLKLNKKSPVIKDEYMHIVKRFRFFGLMPYSMLGFDAYLIDGKVIPMETNKYFDDKGELKAVTLTGIDYDAFNFLQSQIKANIARFQKVDKLLQFAPYMLMVLIVISFIVGMVFYTQHLENVAKIILDYSTKKAAETAPAQLIPNIIK